MGYVTSDYSDCLILSIIHISYGIVELESLEEKPESSLETEDDEAPPLVIACDSVINDSA